LLQINKTRNKIEDSATKKNDYFEKFESPCDQGRRQKNFQGEKIPAIERPRPRNNTNKPSSILSVADDVSHWVCTQDSPQGNTASIAPH